MDRSSTCAHRSAEAMLARIALSDLLLGVAPESEKASPSPTLAVPMGRNHTCCYSCDFCLPAEIPPEQRQGEIVGAATMPVEKASIDQSTDEFGCTGRSEKASPDGREADRP